MPDACDNWAVDEVLTVRCGLVPYEEAGRLQKRIEAARQADEMPDVLLLLEHNPVYTKGRRTQPGELAMGEDWYRMQGIEVCETDRGGAVTYHGPGQLVGYPIVSLKPYGDNVHEYVRRLERLMIGSLAAYGVDAEVIDGLTGVWVGGGRRRGARSARSACTSAAASPPTDSRSTSTTTCSRSSGWSPAGSRASG